VSNISSVEFYCTNKDAVPLCYAMETEAARVKRARVLSQNQIREIEMYSDRVLQTIIKMGLTEQMTDCGNYETYLKL
jgi:hypothetical protein